MAFATGLAQQANLEATVGALVAIGKTETRHEVWALIDVWGEDPFAGPIDTVYAYANQLLYLTQASFIIPGSCPPENPRCPYPSQNLPQLSYNSTTSTGHPGSNITFVYQNASQVPDYAATGKDFYAVFFHGVLNITMPFDTETSSSTVPPEFEEGKGISMAVIADQVGAPTLDSLIAGPLVLLQQPSSLTSITGRS